MVEIKLGGRMANRNIQQTKRVARQSLFTTLWGWFTAPRFGSAGSGGLEYEPMYRTAETPVPSKR
jgi:hypothetical protein